MPRKFIKAPLAAGCEGFGVCVAYALGSAIDRITFGTATQLDRELYSSKQQTFSPFIRLDQQWLLRAKCSSRSAWVLRCPTRREAAPRTSSWARSPARAPSSVASAGGRLRRRLYNTKYSITYINVIYLYHIILYDIILYYTAPTAGESDGHGESGESGQRDGSTSGGPASGRWDCPPL